MVVSIYIDNKKTSENKGLHLVSWNWFTWNWFTWNWFVWFAW